MSYDFGVWHYFVVMNTPYRCVSLVGRSRELDIGKDRKHGTGTVIACLHGGV